MNTDYIHVVLADDDEDDRLFFTDAFSELKINTKVETYNDGAELMKHFSDQDTILPQVLFLDLNMPRKNGFECLKEIRANEKFKDMAVAIYSTSASDEHIEETFVHGANIYIKKPNDFNELKKVLAEVISINWQYHTSGMNKDNFMLKI